MLTVVMTTVAGASDGETLGEKLVEAGLAACVQVLPAMISIYRWEGELQKESEYLLLIKTLTTRYEELEAFLLEHHPYDVPEIIAVDAQQFSQGYFKFVASSTRA